jgi:hypothetical protein
MNNFFSADIQFLLMIKDVPAGLRDLLTTTLSSGLDDAGMTNMLAGFSSELSRHDVQPMSIIERKSTNLMLCNIAQEIAPTAPNTAASLLTHLNVEILKSGHYREEICSTYKTILGSSDLSDDSLISLRRYLNSEFWVPHAVNPSSLHLMLLARGYEQTLGGCRGALRASYLDLAGVFCTKFDTTAKRVSSKLTWLTQVSDMGFSSTLQMLLKTEVDPLVKLLLDAAKRAPIFGPGLEEMLTQMNSLVSHRDEFMKAHPDGLSCLLFEDKNLATLILNALALDSSVLATEMKLPVKSSEIYPLGWKNHAGFSTHPVVNQLGKLCLFMEKVALNSDLKEKSMTNLLGCLATWCGHHSVKDDSAKGFSPRSNRQCNAVILSLVFTEERLDGALALCDKKGLTVLTEYVFDNHRSLRGKIPVAQRGLYLENEMGL